MDDMPCHRKSSPGAQERGRRAGRACARGSLLRDCGGLGVVRVSVMLVRAPEEVTNDLVPHEHSEDHLRLTSIRGRTP